MFKFDKYSIYTILLLQQLARRSNLTTLLCSFPSGHGTRFNQVCAWLSWEAEEITLRAVIDRQIAGIISNAARGWPMPGAWHILSQPHTHHTIRNLANNKAYVTTSCNERKMISVYWWICYNIHTAEFVTKFILTIAECEKFTTQITSSCSEPKWFRSFQRVMKSK